MDFRLSKINVPLLAVAMGSMLLSAGAQQSGQSIIFSSPQNDDAQSMAPSLAPPNSPLPSLPSTLQAPVSPFSYNSTPDELQQLPQHQASSSDQQRMKKMLDDRKNWMLMTPEEIFGATTTDKSLQPTERDAMGREKNQTRVESYLDRENQSLGDRTNRWQNNSPWDLTHRHDRADPLNSQRIDKTDASQNLNQLFGSLRNSDVRPDQNENAGWDLFRPPVPQAPVKPNPEQLAAMERFRQLLEPTPVTTAPPPQSAFFSAPKPVVDPNFTQPAFVANSAGASFTPLVSGIGRPAGLTPLPGITTHLPPPAAIPDWAPKPPPWVSQTPQQFAAPQWKF